MWKRPYGPTITAHEQATAETKWQTLGELKIAIVSKFEQVVEQVIKDLGVLEEIRKAGK